MAETLPNSPKKQSSELDRLSSLPDTHLIEILSLLPLKTAAATSTLSRRWLRLWTHRTHLVFDSYFRPIFNPQRKFHPFFNTINHILNQLTSPHIHTFDLSFRHSPLNNDEFRHCSKSFDSWVPLICSRNPINFKVSFDFGFSGHFITLPQIIFETQSLVQLELTGNLYCKFPTCDFNFPNLNKIVMRLRFDPRVLRTLFKSCPLLETLFLALELMKDEIIDISAHNLKSLTIYMNGPSRRTKFLIDAPLLKDIEVNRCVALFSFVSKPSSLLKANVGFWTQIFRDGTDLTRIVPEFLRGISSVKYLYLVDNLALFDIANGIDANVWLNFRNLTHLSMIVSEESVILDDPIPSHLLSRLKNIEIVGVKGEGNDIKLVKYILSNANVLEMLYISSYADYDADFDKGGSYKLWTEYMFCRTLFKLPRSSLNCKVEFNGSYIIASVDGSGNGSIVSQIDWEGPSMWHYTDEDEE